MSYRLPLPRRIVSVLVVLVVVCILALPAAPASAEPPVSPSFSPAAWIQQLWTGLQETLGFGHAPVPGSGERLCDGGPGLDPNGEPCDGGPGLDPSGLTTDPDAGENADPGV